MPSMTPASPAHAAVLAYRKAAHLGDTPALVAALRDLSRATSPEGAAVLGDLLKEERSLVDEVSAARAAGEPVHPLTTRLNSVRRSIDPLVGA